MRGTIPFTSQIAGMEESSCEMRKRRANPLALQVWLELSGRFGVAPRGVP